MSIPEQAAYLSKITDVLRQQWPGNRAINIVCHGHSVPAGYFATPMVDSLNAYPHLLQIALKERFPFAVINVIVTAIGGENSKSGAVRFEQEVLCHRPDVITIDYALNDRGIGLEKAEASWTSMLKAGLEADVKMILLTPTPDLTQAATYLGEDKSVLRKHAEQVRRLAHENSVGLADSFAAFETYTQTGDLTNVLSWSNHPNRQGHDLVVNELLPWFPAK